MPCGADTWINLAAAVGSVGAAVAAVWLGLSVQYRETRERLTRAQLSAAGITAKLEHTIDITSSGLAHAVFNNLELSEEKSRYEASKNIRELMARGYFKPDLETLLGLSALENYCANRIARAFDILDVIKGQTDNIPLGEYDPSAIKKSYGYSEMLLSQWAVMLSNANDLLTVALRECERVSTVAAPHPSGQELHGEDE
jgi:hypothetical protein